MRAPDSTRLGRPDNDLAPKVSPEALPAHPVDGAALELACANSAIQPTTAWWVTAPVRLPAYAFPEW